MSRVDSFESDTRNFLREGGLSVNVRPATEKEMRYLEDIWFCTHALILDENIAIGVTDDERHELWWYVYMFIDGAWISHNETGMDRTFLEASF